MKVPFFSKKDEEPENLPETNQGRPLTITFSRPNSMNQPKGVGSYGLTPLGRAKVKQLEDNDPNFLILAAIEENGPMTIGHIAERIHMSAVKVNHLVRGRYGLVAGGALKLVGAGGE